MVLDSLYFALAVVAEIAILVAIFELIGLVDTIPTNFAMSRFAQENGWEFQPGRSSMFFIKPFQLVSPYDNTLTITVRRTIGSKYSHSSLKLSVHISNPKRVSLLVKNYGLFEKKHLYFKNLWDGRLFVQSKPVSFGRMLFHSTELLQEVYSCIRTWSLFSGNSIKLRPSGNLEILLIDKNFDSQSAKKLISLAAQISSRIEQIELENQKPS